MEPDSVSFASWAACGPSTDVRGYQQWVAEAQGGWTMSSMGHVGNSKRQRRGQISRPRALGGEDGIMSTRSAR